MKLEPSFLLMASLITLFLGTGCEVSEKELDGYLFAHMMKDDYGSLYYSVSRDGLNWRLLNHGRRIDSNYRGHPDICRGRDGEYYMIGVDGAALKPVLWRSDDLVTWEVHRIIPETVFQDNPGYIAFPAWYGAPKMFYDEATDQYVVTWHAQREGTGNGRERWISMRTFYMLSTDLEDFTKPARLFDFDVEADREMATIDVILRKNGEGYFALIKDERWPEDCETGKTIRISFSENLTGPYSNPGPPITPSWYEAPSIVPGKGNNKWFMYAENYPHRYTLFTADSLNGSWSARDIQMENVRHGCVIRVNAKQFNELVSSF